MPEAPEGFTDARWHIEASNDAGVDHALHPRQYVITCEWCPAIFFGARKADAMRQLDRHREEVYERYVDEGVAAGDFPTPGQTWERGEGMSENDEHRATETGDNNAQP